MSSTAAVTDSTVTGGGFANAIILFGVRVVVDSMRKSVSLNNLSQYEHHRDHSDNNDDKSKTCNKISSVDVDHKDDVAAAGYASADDVVPNSGTNHQRERKRGVPWTEEEHKLFLLGLQKVGKGDWRGISRNFVKTRTPTQVASHAQKYFLRRSNLNRRRRRSSLFDITTDTVKATSMEEEQAQYQDKYTQLHSHSGSYNVNGYPNLPTFPTFIAPASIFPPLQIENPMEKLTLAQGNLETDAASSSELIRRPVAVQTVPHSTTMDELNSNLESSKMEDPTSLSLNLSLQMDSSSSLSRQSKNPAFQPMSRSSFSNGDSIISVA